MVVKSYKLNTDRFNCPFLLSSSYRLSKKIENFKNKDYYGSNYPIVLVEQSRRFYQKKFINLVFLKILKFGYRNISKYSIFKFKLFEKKELNDMYITDNFLIKNLEFKRYFLLCKRIKSIDLKKFIRAIFLNTSFRLRKKLLLRLK